MRWRPPPTKGGTTPDRRAPPRVAFHDSRRRRRHCLGADAVRLDDDQVDRNHHQAAQHGADHLADDLPPATPSDGGPLHRPQRLRRLAAGGGGHRPDKMETTGAQAAKMICVSVPPSPTARWSVSARRTPATPARHHDSTSTAAVTPGECGTPSADRDDHRGAAQQDHLRSGNHAVADAPAHRPPHQGRQIPSERPIDRQPAPEAATCWDVISPAPAPATRPSCRSRCRAPRRCSAGARVSYPGDDRASIRLRRCAVRPNMPVDTISGSSCPQVSVPRDARHRARQHRHPGMIDGRRRGTSHAGGISADSTAGAPGERGLGPCTSSRSPRRGGAGREAAVL